MTIQARLPLHAVGRPASFGLVASAFGMAAAGWLAAACSFVPAAPRLVDGFVAAGGLLLAVHLAGLVFFAFAVTGAAVHVLPVMLRNELPRERGLRLALVLLAGGVPLAAGMAAGVPAAAWAGAGLLAAGLALVLEQIVSLVVRAPSERTLVVSRAGVALSVLHLLAAFALGAIVLGSEGPSVLGAAYERMVLVHLTLAGLGWLSLLVVAVGRTLAPMLALAPAAGRRRAPTLELGFAAGLWVLLGGLAAGVRPLAGAGGAIVAVALGRFALQVVSVARSRRLEAVEGPLGHLLAGVLFLLQAAAFGFAGLAGALDERRAAAAFAFLLLVGWAAGVTVGHLGKLLSLSAWSTWPPGPRPKQAALYPRAAWKAETIAFAVAVELVVAGALVGSEPAASAGAALLVTAAALALAACAVTVRRARAGRGAASYRDSSASAAR